MSNVVNDKCTDNSEDKTMVIKFTACVEGFFTCNDGQCIDIEERCDQTPNCNDKSDELDCRKIVIEDNYNKKIPPFGFNQVTRNIIPCNINVSVDILDILSMQEVHQ